jgi:3-oxoacyl-[acyl-carrier protein] reductase
MLEEKWVLITGASRGIGRSTAHEFSRNGAKLLLVARDRDELEKVQKEIQTLSYIFVCDLANEEAIKKLFLEIRKITKNLDVVVNNAGILYSAPLLMSRREEMEKLFATNLYAVVHISQYASRMMLAQKKGSIINISSLMGISGAKSHALYSASKASLLGLTKSLSLELAPYIRVNAIAPGIVETSLIETMTPQKQEALKESTPLKRFAKDSEIAQTILFFASDMSSFVTGEILRVDGGLCSIEI